MILTKKQQRLRRSRQTRIRISKQLIARLTVNRTNLHTYATIISSDGSRVLATVSTLQSELHASLGGKGANISAASAVGIAIAEKARILGINKVAFDRAGFSYHGRVKALADAARSAGLQF